MGIAIDHHRIVSRVAEGLGRWWSAANEATLAEGRWCLIDDPVSSALESWTVAALEKVTLDDWSVIALEDWALIRRLAADVVAERVGWTGSIRWFRDNVRRLRPEQ